MKRSLVAFAALGIAVSVFCLYSVDLSDRSQREREAELRVLDALNENQVEPDQQIENNQISIDVGAIGVLHTWSQTMMDHPHIHFIVPGGGLNKDRTQWIKARQKFLLPVKSSPQCTEANYYQCLKRRMTRMN
jgi:hypothetical protein